MAKILKSLAAICFVATSLTSADSQAADADADDWPCIQGKVPELSAAMMWGGPPLPETPLDWDADTTIRDMVGLLAVRRTPMDESEQRIQAYAGSLQGEDKNRKMAMIFTGLLQKTNIARKDVLEGITRYARKQRRLVEQIQDQRKALADALNNPTPTPEDDRKRREIEQQLNWQTRIYDDREKSLTYVCEIPVLMEQRLFALARVLVNYTE